MTEQPKASNDRPDGLPQGRPQKFTVLIPWDQKEVMTGDQRKLTSAVGRRLSLKAICLALFEILHETRSCSPRWRRS